MRQIQFVTASKKGAEGFQDTKLMSSLRGAYPIYACLSNPEGLSKVYNWYLNGEFERFTRFGPEVPRAETDIVVFCHDDVQIVANNVDLELNRVADLGFSVMGPVGSEDIKIATPTLWNAMNQTGGMRGNTVFHVHSPDAKTGQIVQVDDQPMPLGRIPHGEVLILDGLFIAVVLDRANAVGWTFDEDYGFHHYDLASCLRAFRMGLRLHTVFIPMIHWSAGLANMSDPIFLQSQKVFLKAFRGESINFGDQLPEGVTPPVPEFPSALQVRP